MKERVVLVAKGPFENGVQVKEGGRCPVCNTMQKPPKNRYARILSCPKCHYVSDIYLVPAIDRGAK